MSEERRVLQREQAFAVGEKSSKENREGAELYYPRIERSRQDHSMSLQFGMEVEMKESQHEAAELEAHILMNEGTRVANERIL